MLGPATTRRHDRPIAVSLSDARSLADGHVLQPPAVVFSR